MPENQAEPELYNLVIRFLIDLSNSETANREILEDCFNKTLQILGYIKGDRFYEDLVWTIQEIIHEKLPSLQL